ncbi:uncharacterized protein LOC117832485 [Notolabrus celidotus]|uniref:uncharacterized protein LOC117832485 n=1 Tax=Notolabrus celidotus TaxID=1203425 RepID=UPI0014902A58|nr:uncharacterized protein LOC117832485 [Notolabrus celidotus]
MSAISLKLITYLCLCGTALSGSDSNGVVWRNLGESVTIQCRSPTPDQHYLYLIKGLEDFQVLFGEKKTGTYKIEQSFTSRLQCDGDLPNVDIVIKNLTSDDIGPYWCEYQKMDFDSPQPSKQRGQGSVIVVVRDTEHEEKCEQWPSKNLVLVSVVICAVILLVILLVFFIWIVKTKTLGTTVKPQRVSNNDVYEDMRGTIRR